LGVAFGKLELLLVRQVAVARDADDDGVADRDLHGLDGRCGDGIELLDFEIALLGRLGLLGEGEGSGEGYGKESRGGEGVTLTRSRGDAEEDAEKDAGKRKNERGEGEIHAFTVGVRGGSGASGGKKSDAHGDHLWASRYS
jgi:hypothetical protein